MEEELRNDALEYHRLPTPGKIADSRPRVSPIGALHGARQPGRGDHQRHGRAGLGNIGPLAAKPVMEGKGVPVQEIRRHRRVRHRDRRKRPRQAGRHRRRAGADLRRHQPGGHQGAGVLLHRAQAARAHEDPGVPRRPARHRDHRRRGRAQRPQDRRQGHRQGEAGVLGRRRRGARLPRPAGEPRPRWRTSWSPTSRAWSTRGARKRWTPTRRVTRRNAGAHARRDHRRRRCLPRPVGRRRAEARDGREMAERPIILALANPEPEIRPELAKQARPDCLIGTGRSDYPNQVNNVAVLPVHFPRRARRRRDHDQRGDEARRRARDRRPGDGRAIGHRRRRLRRRAAFGPDYLIPRRSIRA